MQTNRAKMHGMDEWNDLRYLLAIFRHQTLVGAAHELQVNHTTVGRRLAALERSLGTRLFNRIDQRLIPTTAGEIAVRRAEQIEAQVLGVSSEIAGRDQNLSGRVRVTSVSTVINVLAGQLVSFTKHYPDIDLHLIADQQNLDLRHLEADIALRLARPKWPSAVARRVGVLQYGVFVKRQFLDRADKLPWVAYTDTMMNVPEAQWVVNEMKDERPYAYVSNPFARRVILESSPCRGVLPIAMVPKSSDLVMISKHPVVGRDIWMIYMKELRQNARIKAVREWLSEVCRANLV